MPLLTHERAATSVCTLAEKVYVFGGTDIKKFQRSIEVLSNPGARSIDLRTVLEWSVIEFNFIGPRFNVAFVALNTDELLIFDGSCTSSFV